MLPLTPPKLGRYEIVDEIGKGAMGVVYLARDPLIGRLVALKTFRIGYSVKDQELEQFRVRFMREAQSAGILSHPNIVTIHDVVEQTDEGVAFIAMEYVRGTTLKALLQSDQPMTLGFVVDIVAQVAEALDYAHAHRVIHRDVKPANILITADNRVKITDFGIARLDTSNLTQEGQLLGTPNYMAPEQIQGKEVDHRADLFALGVVFYEMLTRHKPFQGENLTVVSHRIVYDQFTPPKDYARDLPPGVERVLNRALEKDPARRYQRAKDMVEDLRRVLAETSRDDLNETLSIASWAAPAPGQPGSPPPPPGGAATAGASAPAPGAAPSPAPAAEATPKAPRAPASPRSPRRLAWIAGIAALLVVLAATAVLLGISWSGGEDKPPVDPAADRARVRYVSLVQQGQAHLRAGNFPAAVHVFQQAQHAAQEPEQKRQAGLLLQTAQGRLNEQIQTLSRAEQVATYLSNALEAFRNRRYAEAIVAADVVLSIEPENPEARRIRTEAQKEATKLAEKPQPVPGRPARQRDPVASAATPQPQPTPAAGTSETSPAVQTARLRVVLRGRVAEATVRVDAGSKRVFSHTFRARRVGLRRRLEPIAEERSVELPSGLHDLRVLVAPGGKAAEVVNRSGNFPAGEIRSLEIDVSDTGSISVDLD